MFNKILPALICFSVTTISSAESSSGLSMNVNGFVGSSGFTMGDS